MTPSPQHSSGLRQSLSGSRFVGHSVDGTAEGRGGDFAGSTSDKLGGKLPAIYLKQLPDGEYEAIALDAPYATLRYSNRTPNGPYVVTGPVIGKVTQTTARILIETNVSCQVTCFLTDSDGHQWAVQKSFKRNIPGAFAFKGLNPATYHVVTLNIPVPGLLQCAFRTIRNDWFADGRHANFAFVSCNKYRVTRDEVTESVDLWKDLYKNITRGLVDYVVHLGSNVHTEANATHHNGKKLSRWHAALRLIDGMPRDKWRTCFETICELCRDLYRQTWNHPATKHALANAPNLMIMADNEICTHWGYHSEHYDKNSAEYFVGCCFYNVYNEYQRNLYEDYESVQDAYDSTNVGQTFHSHVIGSVGLMLTDTRGSKTFHRNHVQEEGNTSEELPHLGAHQWNNLETYLSKEGNFADCRMLFAICTQPPCYVGEGPNMVIEKLSPNSNGIKGSWSVPRHVPECSAFLQQLFDWRAAEPGRREVCIVAGEVRESGYTEIVDLRYDNFWDRRSGRMKQITTSPIADATKKFNENEALQFFPWKMNQIGDSHRFAHATWTGGRTYNIVSVYTAKDDDAEERYCLRGPGTFFSSQMFTANASKKKPLPPVVSYSKGYFGELFSCGKASRAISSNAPVEDYRKSSSYTTTHSFATSITAQE